MGCGEALGSQGQCRLCLSKDDYVLGGGREGLPGTPAGQQHQPAVQGEGLLLLVP